MGSDFHEHEHQYHERDLLSSSSSSSSIGCVGFSTKFSDFAAAIVFAEIREMAAMMSPKRPLSLSRDLLDAVQTTGPKQGAKPTEVYGFVGAISTLVGFVVFLVWAYLPEPWLHSMGITYYPNRYWVMAIPAYVLVAIVFVVSFYTSLNYMATPPPCSFNSLFDEYTRGPFSTSQLLHEADRPIHAISDIPITTVNALVFGGLEQ